MAGTISLSFFTYLTSPHKSLVSNMVNLIGIINTTTILGTLLFTRRGKRIPFTPFQKVSLGIAGMIALSWIIIVWGFKGTGIIPNVLTQILMIVGYTLTLQKLWGAQRNTESLFTWWCIFLSSVFAVYTGWVSNDKLALLYAVRSTVMSFTLVLLMHRAEYRSRVRVRARIMG